MNISRIWLYFIMDNSKIIQIYCDGASKGNPGPAGAGSIAYLNDQVLYELSEYLGIQTNNFAEYSALLLSLKKLLEIFSDPEEYQLEIYMDSELVVKQLNREYKIKSKNLIEIYYEILNLLKKFKQYTISYIPREKNKIADKLASQNIFF